MAVTGFSPHWALGEAAEVALDMGLSMTLSPSDEGLFCVDFFEGPRAVAGRRGSFRDLAVFASKWLHEEQERRIARADWLAGLDRGDAVRVVGPKDSVAIRIVAAVGDRVILVVPGSGTSSAVRSFNADGVEVDDDGAPLSPVVRLEPPILV